MKVSPKKTMFFILFLTTTLYICSHDILYVDNNSTIESILEKNYSKSDLVSHTNSFDGFFEDEQLYNSFNIIYIVESSFRHIVSSLIDHYSSSFLPFWQPPKS